MLCIVFAFAWAFKRFRLYAKNGYWLRYVCVSVCPFIRVGQLGSH